MLIRVMIQDIIMIRKGVIKELNPKGTKKKQGAAIFCSHATSKPPKLPANPMKTNRQIRLGRDFHLLNITQFLGAFNDNVFKLFLIYALIAMKGEEAITSINHLAGAIFVLPFLIFASSAGFLAGKLRKQAIIKHIKLV